MAKVTSCDNCGACCLGMDIPLFSLEEFQQLPEELAQEIDEAIDAGLSDLGNSCLWFDQATKTCKHYEHRPEVCREFGVGSEDCMRRRRAEEVAAFVMSCDEVRAMKKLRRGEQRREAVRRRDSSGGPAAFCKFMHSRGFGNGLEYRSAHAAWNAAIDAAASVAGRALPGTACERIKALRAPVDWWKTDDDR